MIFNGEIEACYYANQHTANTLQAQTSLIGVCFRKLYLFGFCLHAFESINLPWYFLNETKWR